MIVQSCFLDLACIAGCVEGAEGFTHFWQGYRLIINTGRITVFLDEACNIAVRADASFSLR